MTCAQCEAELLEAALACASCNRLVHAAKLETVAASAKAAEEAKKWTEALALWREALPLIPPGTRQHIAVSDKIATIEPLAIAQEEDKRGLAKWIAIVGPIGLLAWKFKAVLLFAATKGKLLLFGLTKLTTLSTMLLSLSFYWSMYGWWFALGIILSIYIHEMGHVSELRRFGIPASAPMFIPGFGAIIISKARAATVGQEARIGLAGPVWGTAAAVGCAAVYWLTGIEIWKALARWGAWINLFNLVPVWQLDGGWAFHALTRQHRVWAAVSLLVMWFWVEDMLLLIVGGVAVWRLFTNDYPEKEDRPVALLYVGLVVTLGMLCLFQIAEKR
jgi:Zn-dependent protease